MDQPDLSLIMPCYNEQEVVEATARQLIGAFEQAGVRLVLVAVDNGSTDGTLAILRRLREEFPTVRIVRVEENVGYGNGVLQGLTACDGRWVGIIPADGQVDADDVVRLYQSAAQAPAPTLAKARRRFRMDGLLRRVVSVSYNGFVWLLWPNLGSIDVNGSPKILPRWAIEAMDLESKRWFLDPEIMIKAHYLGLRVMERNVFARMRGGGVSHVRASTCLEFLRSLLAYRFGNRVSRWRQGLSPETLARARGGAHGSNAGPDGKVGSDALPQPGAVDR